MSESEFLPNGLHRETVRKIKLVVNVLQSQRSQEVGAHIMENDEAVRWAVAGIASVYRMVDEIENLPQANLDRLIEAIESDTLE